MSVRLTTPERRPDMFGPGREVVLTEGLEESDARGCCVCEDGK